MQDLDDYNIDYYADPDKDPGFLQCFITLAALALMIYLILQ